MTTGVDAGGLCSGMVMAVPINGSLVMSRAFDPYHRIRAAVGAIFILSVLSMAMTMHGTVRRTAGSQDLGATVPSVTGVPVVPAAAAVAPLPLTAHPAAAAAAAHLARSAARQRAGRTP